MFAAKLGTVGATRCLSVCRTGLLGQLWGLGLIAAAAPAHTRRNAIPDRSAQRARLRARALLIELRAISIASSSDLGRTIDSGVGSGEAASPVLGEAGAQ